MNSMLWINDIITSVTDVAATVCPPLDSNRVETYQFILQIRATSWHVKPF